MKENNRRKFSRYQLVHQLSIFEYDTRESLGHLVDISSGGGLLINQNPVPIGTQFRMLVILPIGFIQETDLDIEVETISEIQVVDNHYYISFRFVNVYPEHQKVIDYLIEKYSYLKDAELLSNIQGRWNELAELLEEMNSDRICEDLVYRFYHQSFKVYHLQDETQKMVTALKNIAPSGTVFCALFDEICQASASDRQFEPEHNENWSTHTRVFVEAFFHAKFFLEMAVKYGKELKTPPSLLPSGWAALLSLYGIR